MFDYPEICSELLGGLAERQREIISRRFVLLPKASAGSKTEKETLESIGRDFGLTRERVRQIEKDGFLKIMPKLKEYQKVFQYFEDQLESTGGLRKEEILLFQLGGAKYQPHVFFLLTLAEQFQRFSETKEFHSFWATNPDSFDETRKVIDSFYQKLQELNKPLKLSDYTPEFDVSAQFLEYFLEISKIIQKNEEGFFGLKDWPEINPRSIKDKAFLVLKKVQKPLHFKEVSSAIGPDALVETVHNELIRDPRFVLVGRGLYALKEWGFEEGYVKDVIIAILREAGKPLSKQEILESVAKQRFVKKSTILLNLANKKHFLKTPEGKYILRES